MVELVDTSDLGSDAARCGGSSPFTRTKAEDLSSAFFIEKTKQKNGQVQHRYNILSFFGC